MGDGLHGIDNINVDFKDLELTNQLIGSGQYGEVTKATLYGIDVCLKRMIMTDDVEEDNKYIDRELKVLQSIHHPNIMQFMGVCKHEGEIYLVTEFVEGGNLRELIKSDKALPWPVRVRILVDIAAALAYLHQKHIIHRDIKSQNMLLDSSMRIKVCDFGFARTTTRVVDNVQLSHRPRRMTTCGTDEWMAPEVLLKKPYSERADVFSFGILVCEVLSRRFPDQNLLHRYPNLRYAVRKDDIVSLTPQNSPPELQQLAIDCTLFDPEDRPDMKEIVRRLKIVMKRLLDAEELAKVLANQEQNKKHSIAKTIVKVELHIKNVNLQSIALFACENQPLADFINVVCNTINNRLGDGEKIDPAQLILTAPFHGQLIKLSEATASYSPSTSVTNFSVIANNYYNNNNNYYITDEAVAATAAAYLNSPTSASYFQGEVTPFYFFTENVGIEKNFSFHLFSIEEYNEFVLRSTEQNKPRRNSFFFRHASIAKSNHNLNK